MSYFFVFVHFGSLLKLLINYEIMKTKLLLMMLFFSSISFSQLTQSFQAMGSNDFSQFSYNRILSLKHDNNNVLYSTTFTTSTSGTKWIVQKLNGLVWESVGFNTLPNNSGVFEFDNNNVLYYAYSDNALSNKLSVVKYNGVSWELVGSAGFSGGYASGISLDFSSTNVPYVAFNDGNLGTNGLAVVRRFNGTSWVVVGTAGISTQGTAPFIKIDATNNPYITYQENTSTLITKKYNGFSWVDVATASGTYNGISNPLAFNSNNEPHFVSMYNNRVNKVTSTGQVVQIGPSLPSNIENCSNIAIDSNNVVYIYGMDYSQAANGRSRVLKFDGTAWVFVGQLFEAHASPVLSIDSNNVPYAYFQDNSNSTGNGFLYRYNGEIWDLINSSGISTDYANYTSITIANNNVPYITYQDIAENGKATVKKYNGTSWTNVGSLGFTPGQAEFTSIKTKDNIPYLVYKDLASSGKASVQKFNGTSWEYVGNQGFSDGEVFSTAIAFGSSNDPYVVYKDAANANKITVRTFNGTSWSTVGTAGFSAGEVFDTSIAVTSGNTVYVTYKDMANGGKITVQGFNGSSWQVLGTAGFSTGEVNYTKIAVDTGDIPQVVYQDVSLSKKAIVKRFNGILWENVGSATGISVGGADFLDIVTDNNNLPWIVYSDNSPGFFKKVEVLNYNGQTWLQNSSYGLSRRQGNYCSIALNHNNIPVVAYKSQHAFAKFRGPVNTFPLSVDENTISDNQISIYPNPVKNTFSISGSDTIEEVAVFDLLGKQTLNLKNVSQNINIEFLPKGFYIVKVKTAVTTKSLKIIKE
jgi:hypothetical protein